MSVIMHELAHAIHFLNFSGKTLAEQPLDYSELPSVYAEIVGKTDATRKLLLPDSSEKEVASLKPSIFWFLGMLRSLAVYQALHSQGFDPEISTPEELKRYALAVAQKFWPTKLPSDCDPMEQPCMWMIDGSQSRLAYVRNYVKAFSLAEKEVGSFPNLIDIEETESFVTRVLSGERPRHPLQGFKAELDAEKIVKRLRM